MGEDEKNFAIYASWCSRAQRRCRVKNGSAIHKTGNNISNEEKSRLIQPFIRM